MNAVAVLPAGRSTPPPVTSLDSPRHASPIMLLSSGRGSRQSRDCLALMWPTSSEDNGKHSLSPSSSASLATLGGTLTSSHRHDRVKLDSTHGEGTVSVDRAVEVLVCPSGQTVVRMQASFEAVLPSPNAKQALGTPGSNRKQLALPHSPRSPSWDRSRSSSPSYTSLMSSNVGRSGARSSHPRGRSLLFDSDGMRQRQNLPDVQRDSPKEMRGGGDMPSTPSSSLKKKSPRRRKISGRDGKEKTKFTGGAQEILEQDHPEEDEASQGRSCPCLRFIVLVILAAVLLSVVFYLSIWLVAQRRGSPVVPASLQGLETMLRTFVFGQPLVVSFIPRLLSTFFAGNADDKMLVLMFDGKSGLGKTHVANLIANELFPENARSQCVHMFMPSFHEIEEHLVTVYDYSIALEDWIDHGRANHRICPHLLYVLEDLRADGPTELLQAVTFTFLSVRKRQSAQDQKMLFILMSNIQGDALSQYTLKELSRDRKREEMTLEELLSVMQTVPTIQDDVGGTDDTASEISKSDFETVYSQLISVVDHHIPFLPLERHHVILCIRQTMSKRNISLADADVEWIADKLAYYPDVTPVFSSSGCKKVEEKANLLSKYSKS